MALNLEAAMGSMSLLANMGRKGFLDGLGVSQFEFNKLTSDEPWLSSDRNRMTVVLHTLMNASCDHMGLPRFTFSAEWLAAAIVMFVKGINVQSACWFGSSTAPVDDMAVGGFQMCKPEQVFALVQLMYDKPGASSARALFEKNTGLALSKVNEMVDKQRSIK